MRHFLLSALCLSSLTLFACGGPLDDPEATGADGVEAESVVAKGIDYSWARPGGAAIKAAGYHFVARYLSHDTSGKTLTHAEATDLHNHGQRIVLVWEDGAQNALGGHGQGVADAHTALSQANALGFPGNLPIYFAVDFDASPAQQTEIDAYLTGAASVIGPGRVGVYGGFYVVERSFQHHTAAFGWQTLAWSGGQVLKGIHLYQNGQSAFSGGADVDEARLSNYGGW